MMIKCIKDVMVSGVTVYVEGNEYYCEEKYDESGELVSHEITGECGMGVFLAGDPSLSEYFDIDYTPIKEEKPKGINKLLNLFRKH